MSTNSKLFRLQLARTGKFGVDGKEITKENLKDVVDTFEKQVPVSIGHQVTKSGDWWPSFGNVETVFLEEKGEEAVLIGDVQIDEVLSEAIKNNFYPGWSVSIPPRASDGKRYLHHLAFLGATPPAIRDLKILKVSSENDEEKGILVDETEAFIPSSQAEYSFSDMGLTPSSISEEGEEKGEEVSVPEEEEKEEGSKDFSDEVDPRIAKAKEILKKSRKEKILSAFSPLVPKSAEKDLQDFADYFVSSYDFSDEEPEIIKVLERLAKAMEVKAAKPKLGRSDFSDLGRKDTKSLDYQALARKF